MRHVWGSVAKGPARSTAVPIPGNPHVTSTYIGFGRFS
ncbi:hypothetical protein JYK04_07579 [Streptomyces nojiriensis]|nr:hypothetical protein JYK04_07579 [Streptomyces nojiriensis]